MVGLEGRCQGKRVGEGVGLPITTSHLHLVAVSPLPAPSCHRVTTLSGLRAADGHLHYLPVLGVFKGTGAIDGGTSHPAGPRC